MTTSRLLSAIFYKNQIEILVFKMDDYNKTADNDELNFNEENR